jgi:23S rRNA (cytosine1962-C5)-methyltransferase
MNKSVQHSYTLLDSGEGFKLEQFGHYRLSRPCSQAVWKQVLPKSEWLAADAYFTREGDAKWQIKRELPDSWTISIADLIFKISTTDFGHLGIFPEQRDCWEWLPLIIEQAKQAGRERVNVLNLFAYSGGSTLAAAKSGAHVCHLDASKGMVHWAKENAALNNLQEAPIRWIVDDVNKFLAREQRRGIQYDGIILDPPTFGRGVKGEIFKIEEDLQDILQKCASLLTSKPLFVFFSCHSPGFSPIVMHHLLSQMMETHQGNVEAGEMVLRGSDEAVLSLPSGVYARWLHA